MKRLVTLVLLCMSTAVGAQIQCGIPPIPPVGCKLGPCVCDAHGNCAWQFVCG